MHMNNILINKQITTKQHRTYSKTTAIESNMIQRGSIKYIKI